MSLPAFSENPGDFLDVAASCTGRRWVARLGDERLALAISQRLGVAEIVGRVMAARGVGLADADDYLSPKLKSALPEPFELTDMEAAVARTAAALMAGEKIGVFGDYDVDGATSSALLKRYFKAIGADLTVHIPDRMREGYGPNLPALSHMQSTGVQLVLTVDCGTMAFEPLAGAKAAGLDVIVLDHHKAEPVLPEAVAVVNPNRLDDTSGQGQLAAVGVTFLFVVALNRALREAGYFGPAHPEPDLRSWLDLVALGTICDVVPLTGVNRALVTLGLKVMARRENKGIAALADIGRVAGPPGTYHAGFVFGPRINAGGRVGQSDLGVRLLTTEDPGTAAALAVELDAFNKERQAIEQAVLEEARAQAELAAESDPPIIMVAGEGWHAGVIGIVASRLTDQYRRPSLVVAFDESGMGKGSARSIEGVDIGGAVTAAVEAGLLASGGGHLMAAGLSVEHGRYDAFRAFLYERLDEAVRRQRGEAVLKIDGLLTPGGATRELYELLQQAGPYGASNPEPRFALADVQVKSAAVVGAGHVRCTLRGRDNRALKGIAFRAAETPLGQALLAARDGTVHVAGRLRADDWQGRADVQFTIEDVAFG